MVALDDLAGECRQWFSLDFISSGRLASIQPLVDTRYVSAWPVGEAPTVACGKLLHGLNHAKRVTVIDYLEEEKRRNFSTNSRETPAY